jgi:hypothetical protein
MTYFRDRKSQQLFRVLSLTDSFHIIMSYLSQISFNIILHNTMKSKLIEQCYKMLIAYD